jgi:hypothetical protein
MGWIGYTKTANWRNRWKGRENLRKEIVRKDGDEKDLSVYDEKVYKAQRVMYMVHEQKLKELGVPFFGVSQKFIVSPGDDNPYGKITPEQLVNLQKRMVQHLQDMYEWYKANIFDGLTPSFQTKLKISQLWDFTRLKLHYAR